MTKRKYVPKSETTEEKKRMVCRCGAGIERTAGSCDTPGFQLKKIYELVHDMRGFDRLDMPRNHQRITQCSLFLMQGWRANVDLQYLIYKSDPDEIDASDISRVTNYVASYCCKGNETSIQEKNHMKALINCAEEKTGDVDDIRRMARKMLNECSKKRVISRQEALCQLLKLDLTYCSEKIYSVSLSGNHRLDTEDSAKKTFLVEYATRSDQFKNLSLHQYFHYKHNISKRGERNFVEKIPNYSGARIEPVYPVNAGYARAVLLLHQPWQKKFEFDQDEETCKNIFHDLLEDKERCPPLVALGYAQAVESYRARAKEPTNKTVELDYSTYEIRGNEEIEDLVDLVGTLHATSDDNKDEDEEGLDFGLHHNWSHCENKVSDDNSCFANFTEEYMYPQMSLIPYCSLFCRLIL